MFILIGTRMSRLYDWSINNSIRYFIAINTALHELPALFGFMVFLTILNQLVSGVMLALSLLPETMVVPTSSEEEDVENLYADDFFWLHESGVDYLVIFIILHLGSNLYLNATSLENDYSWSGGVISFLVLQYVIFSGIALSSTHLSDVTVTIATNAFNSFFLFFGNLEWVLLTDGMLNDDTLVSLTYTHYMSAFFLLFFGFIHSVDVHYDWQPDFPFESINPELAWTDEVINNEIGKVCDMLVLFTIGVLLLYVRAEPVTYDYFAWGDIGMVTDVSFYSVAPHWYFRPYMAWLIACPYHYLGIFGLVYFFLVLYFQVHVTNSNDELYSKLNLVEFSSYFSNLNNIFNEKTFSALFPGYTYSLEWNNIHIDTDLQWDLSFSFLIIAVLYTGSYLPYGRFYHSIGGNFMTLGSFMYIFLYLGFYPISCSWAYCSLRVYTIN